MKGLCIMVWLGLCLLWIGRDARGQSAAVLRLRNLVKEGPAVNSGGSDTAYVNALNQLSRSYYGVNADSAFLYSRRAQHYADSTHYKKGEADSWRMIGNTYEMIGNYQE